MTSFKKKRPVERLGLKTEINDDIIADALRSVEKHKRRDAVEGQKDDLGPQDETQEIIVDPKHLFDDTLLEAPLAGIRDSKRHAPAAPANDSDARGMASLEPDSADKADNASDKAMIEHLRSTVGTLSRQKLALQETVTELEQALRAKNEEINRNQELARRAAADLENYKKRAAREKREHEKYGAEVFLRELLPVMDNLERALEHARETPELSVLNEGVQMTLTQFASCLKRFGVSRIEVQPGAPFDPAVHEAMWEEESELHPPNSVARVVQAGYLLQERLLRASLVSVSRGKEARADAGDASPASETTPTAETSSATGRDEREGDLDELSRDVMPENGDATNARQGGAEVDAEVPRRG